MTTDNPFTQRSGARLDVNAPRNAEQAVADRGDVCSRCGGTGILFFGGLGQGSHLGLCPDCQSDGGKAGFHSLALTDGL